MSSRPRPSAFGLMLPLAWTLCAGLCAAAGPAAEPPPARPAGPHPFSIDDLLSLRGVSDPQLSPDGEWVAYVVESIDRQRDARNQDVFMTRWDGSRTLQLTHGDHDEHTPRFSPDGRWMSFLSDRECEHETDQLWLLERAGGEAERVTDLPGGVSDCVWAPDGRRLALIVDDADPDARRTKDAGDDADSSHAARPIVIDRYYFKEDKTGYLRHLRSHLALFDLASRRVELLIPGDFDESQPAWAPDGSRIAFVSKRDGDPDRNTNFDVWTIEPRAGTAPQRVTTFDGPDNEPDLESPLAFSPDGTRLAYLQGGPQKLIYYAVNQLAIANLVGTAGAGGGAGAGSGTAATLGSPAEAPAHPALPLASVDRNVARPQWSADGKSVTFLLEDDGEGQLASVQLKDGRLARLVTGPRCVEAFTLGAKGRLAALVSTPQQPAEVFAVERGGVLRPLSHVNDARLDQLRMPAAERLTWSSDDGTSIHGLLLRPVDAPSARPAPTILWLHGGPVSQYEWEWRQEAAVFAAAGYAVVLPNPRGSSGRGAAFASAIFADWGNKDARDVLAGIDRVVAMGVADPQRLGVGGWSYGGMLTNYVIAQDSRFRAACSGASISNALAGYGTDMYVREYEQELGVPWRAPEAYSHVSDPFLHADRIHTPTLFMCGQRDFNVPLLNSEQMYQALRSLGVPAQLVIYPGQFHGIRRPSYVADRLQRYLEWFGRWLRADAPDASPAARPVAGAARAGG